MPTKPCSGAVFACILHLLASACSSMPTATTARKLTTLKAETMSADYHGDLAALARLRGRAAALAADPQLGYVARYWTGYASWRIAINGANAKMSQEDLHSHLARAAADFDAVVRERPDFVDGYAAGAGVYAWLPWFFPEGSDARQHNLDRSRALLKRAREMAPDNPRVAWILGGVYLYAPPAMGGDPKRALEIYAHAIDVAPATDPTSPLPDWGKPELLMSLAYAHLHGNPPKPDAAEREARDALALAPEWHYVRDVLLPQILQARGAARSGTSG
jgi:hypothetical protein